MPLIVGTSGWNYRDWRGDLYPAGLPARRWLTAFASEFTTVELNNSFYRLPERSTFERWAGEVPEGFVFAVKAELLDCFDPSEDVYVYFNNDAHGCAVRNARSFLRA